MRDSPTKNLIKPANTCGQVLWRGSEWLLFIPSNSGENPNDSCREGSAAALSSNSQQGLDELATDLSHSGVLRSHLQKTLLTFDYPEAAADGTATNPAQTPQNILQSITDLLKVGYLKWLPCEADPANDNHSTSSARYALIGQTEKDSPNISTPSKKNTQKKTPLRCATPENVAADKSPPRSQIGRKTSDTKSLIERFTSGDAITGEPVSRWLAIAGRVPGVDDSAAGGIITAMSAHTILQKPGKLSSGRINSKHPVQETGHCTISMVSGEELLEQVDFALPGPIPLRWQRTYRSSHGKDLGLGAGWASLLLSRLDLREQQIIYCDGEGREIPFGRLAVGESCFNSIEQLGLYCDDTTVYRIVTPEHHILTFGGSGKRRRLYEIANRSGHAIKLFYSANDRLIQILDSAGRRLKIDYNIAEQMRRVFLCDEKGEFIGKPLVEYCYNNDCDLVKVIDANGNAQAFEYRFHVITKHTGKDGFSFHCEWDEYTIKGKCIRYWGDHNIYHYRFKYDDANKITRRTDAYGNTAEYHYNDLGLITTAIDPQGGVTQYTYDTDGRLLSVRNPIGNTTSYAYDARGRLTRFADSAGAVTRIEYDNGGNPVKITDPLEQVWEREDDAQGLLLRSKDPSGRVTQLTYSSKGRLSTLTDSFGRNQHFDWSDMGELLCSVDAANGKTQFAHDEFGRITRITAAGNRTTHISYDNMNNVTQVIHPSGASVQMQYTPQGNLTQYIDTIGRSTRYKYDGLSQPTERTDPNGQRLRYEYDKQRNLTALTNENGERYELEYDKNQRVIMETGFDGRIQQYHYDAAGHLVRHLDGSHRVTSFKRDPMGRLLQKRTSTGEITQYEYDALGQLTKAYNNHCVLSFRYDSLGQLIGEIQNHRRIEHRYDAPGQKTHTILPNGATIRYAYDQRGLLTRITHSGRILCEIARDEFGQETLCRTGNVSSQFSHDPMGRLIRQQTLKDEIPLWGRSYRYDKMGNLRQIDELSGAKIKFHYDALDRLQTAEGLAKEQFTFDPAGNLLDSQYPEPEGFVQGNRLRVFQNYRFEYDDVGNLVRQFQGKLETRLYYNVANQLVRAHKNAQTFEYSYDPLGRRIKKQDAHGETVYLWDGDHLIHEQCNNVNTTYIYQPGCSNPLCLIRDDEVYYFHADQSGTTHIVTNLAGELVWKAAYKAYGAVFHLEVQAIDNPIRFAGWYYDRETGLYYSGHRYYHPAIGRFVQQDPLGLAGGSNHYRYPRQSLAQEPPGGRLNPGSGGAQSGTIRAHFYPPCDAVPFSPMGRLFSPIRSPVSPEGNRPCGSNQQGCADSACRNLRKTNTLRGAQTVINTT